MHLISHVLGFVNIPISSKFCFWNACGSKYMNILCGWLCDTISELRYRGFRYKFKRCLFSQGQVASGSSSENLQQTSGSTQTLGTSRQSEAANFESQGTHSSYPSASVPMGYYALQREAVFPERPGQPECQFYMKTGDCKFGAVCKFHHPRERVIPAPDCVLSSIGLPLRPVS